MAILKTDSPLCRRIVHSFLDFLDSVEPTSGDDLEGLEVAKDCLAEVFKINQSCVDSRPKSNLLINIFKSEEASEQQEIKSNVIHESLSVESASTSSIQNASDASPPQASQSAGEDLTREAHNPGLFDDGLFGQFCRTLDKIRYFKTTNDGRDDQVQVDRATILFKNAVTDMGKSGCQKYDQKSFAETLKSQGNKAMQAKLFSDAIELYSCAIAHCEENAVYHCNRAAAYTQIHQYTEAIRDCLKSIEIDPNYSKAYSRLGFAYYAQGNYRDAINKGFMKALQLDPNNDSVKENIRVAEQKLKEEQQRTDHDESSSSANHQSAWGSRSQGTTPPFSSMPFNINGSGNGNGIPSDIASMFMNMAASVHQGQNSQDPPEAGGTADTFHEPGIRVDRNININLGEHNINLGEHTINLGEQMPMPEDLTGALRSVMEMFTGAAHSANPPDDANGRSAPS